MANLCTAAAAGPEFEVEERVKSVVPDKRTESRAITKPVPVGL